MTDSHGEGHEHTAVSPLDTFLDVIRNMFPENVIQATFQRVQTSYYTQKPKTKTNSTNFSPRPIIKKRIDSVQGMNILGKCHFVINKS
jgi:solute carrier family 1 (high affinity glutamate transporter) protein 2